MNIKQIDVSGHKYDICDAKMRDAVADEYDVLSTYRQGDFCIYNNVVYRCLEETTGVWQETKWEKKTLAELYKEMEIMTHISDAFSESKEYAAGKYCIYENELYKFTAAKTAGAWDQQKVVATSVDAELRELNANITKKQDASTAITTGNVAQQSVKYATTAGSANAVAWGNVSGKPGTYPPSGHNHDDRYYTETEVNAKINNLKKVELILPYSDLTSSTKTFALSKNWASFKYVWVGLACNSDNVFLWKSGLIIPTEMLKIAHGNYQVSCIYDLTDFYVNAEVDFSNANHINSRITSHGSDAGFSNARIYVFGLEEP